MQTQDFQAELGDFVQFAASQFESGIGRCLPCKYSLSQSH